MVLYISVVIIQNGIRCNRKIFVKSIRSRFSLLQFHCICIAIAEMLCLKLTGHCPTLRFTCGFVTRESLLELVMEIEVVFHHFLSPLTNLGLALILSGKKKSHGKEEKGKEGTPILSTILLRRLSGVSSWGIRIIVLASRHYGYMSQSLYFSSPPRSSMMKRWPRHKPERLEVRHAQPGACALSNT